MPTLLNCTTAQAAVDHVLQTIGGEIRLGVPLGLGKPNRFVNALYQRARQDSSVSLTIYTALSLGRPSAGSGLQQRFLGPFLDRVFSDYEELDYLKDLRADRLPPNVQVVEFFFQPGAMLTNKHAQKNYISSNYTHAPRDINALGVNVVAQLVARNPDGDDGHVSLSCNPEIALDLKPLLDARREAGEDILVIAQVHQDLPFMARDARVPETFFDLIIDDPDAHTALFVTPNMPVGLQEHVIGLNTSVLIRDGGTLQIGIGALGDAVAYHLVQRHTAPTLYQDLTEHWGITRDSKRLIEKEGGVTPFSQGLYGCSEMLTYGLLMLLQNDIIRRPVFSDIRLQSLLDAQVITPVSSLENLHALQQQNIIAERPHPDDVRWLLETGLLPQGTRILPNGRWQLADGTEVAPELSNKHTQEALQAFLGQALPGATLIHGGFFLGPGELYQILRQMPQAQRDMICMTAISSVNHLYGDEPRKRVQRRHARFVNSVFAATLLGAGVSDQLDDGRVLSGVGGQYNFVSQAQELVGARSILMLRAWRERGAQATSNILLSYGHNTIARHLRDIYVTEYGIADTRGQSDQDVVAAMLAIADSRFQPELLEQAKAAGKISADYVIPEARRYNLPERLATLQQTYRASFPLLPFGGDFTPVEQDLLQALQWLRGKLDHKKYLTVGRQALLGDPETRHVHEHMARMSLTGPTHWREHLYRRLLVTALNAVASQSA